MQPLIAQFFVSAFLGVIRALPQVVCCCLQDTAPEPPPLLPTRQSGPRIDLRVDSGRFDGSGAYRGLGGLLGAALIVSLEVRENAGHSWPFIACM